MAQIYGRQFSMTPYADCARKHKLALLEDLAESYAGPTFTGTSLSHQSKILIAIANVIREHGLDLHDSFHASVSLFIAPLFSFSSTCCSSASLLWLRLRLLGGRVHTTYVFQASQVAQMLCCHFSRSDRSSSIRRSVVAL